MAKKTTIKLPAKPFTGKEGNTFSKENQPDPILKKIGWQKLREQRHLTQAILKEMLGEDGSHTDSFKGLISSLVVNAKHGNPKAIDIISKCLEDDIQKIEQTNLNYTVSMSKEEMKEINKELESEF